MDVDCIPGYLTITPHRRSVKYHIIFLSGFSEKVFSPDTGNAPAHCAKNGISAIAAADLKRSLRYIGIGLIKFK